MSATAGERAGERSRGPPGDGGRRPRVRQTDTAVRAVLTGTNVGAGCVDQRLRGIAPGAAPRRRRHGCEEGFCLGAAPASSGPWTGLFLPFPLPGVPRPACRMPANPPVWSFASVNRVPASRAVSPNGFTPTNVRQRARPCVFPWKTGGGTTPCGGAFRDSGRPAYQGGRADRDRRPSRGISSG